MKKVSNVFWITVVLVAIAVIYGIIDPQGFETSTGNLQSMITSGFGWYYLIIVSIFVIVCLFFIVSPLGSIRLGKPDEKPEYSTISWFAMLFSAGMGIGLVFWGAAEPLSHYLAPPTATPETNEAIRESMKYAFFHWGLHAWAIYAIVALALAYFKFRKGKPGLISATLSPILGKYSEGKIGTLVDVIAVFATVVGVATTLGFGASQINGGLSYLFNIPNSFNVQLIIIAIVTVLFMISATTGVSRGIRYLSNANMVLAIILFLAVLIVGPTLFILNMFTDSIGAYAQNIVRMSFQIAPLNEDHRAWIDGWTIFYWAWWISWSPFVGIFIARVSRGRTIREFLTGVLLAPCLVGFLWFSAFGATAIDIQSSGIADLSGFATEQTLFAVFDQLPLGPVLSIVAILLISTFFITSADSATYVLGMQTTHGSLNPSNSVKLTWGLAQSTVALILLYSGGLQALQNALIAGAFPFSFIMILMVIALYRSLREEQKQLGLYVRPRKVPTKKE
ncbi:glycine betaine uptake BCCT transporter [Mangrovibacillus cuniculi]|uniref:BCCT family transporter n=1 Tax=Mangrovibacillus cuniculi TaxID=2593652 RepID=A0A7S8CAK4_9BACI|nr:BCCT family transporter [Mangrovibacillus cuniculi]QPC46457.1 BCCT family transporter [Mangrovibacillus cuniculi]